MRRDLDTDLHAVRHEHLAIHQRLLNWSMYVRESGFAGACQPMFRLYRPYLVPRESSGGSLVDSNDAIALERAVAKLPERHAYAIRWAYVFPWRSEDRIRRLLAVTRPDLQGLIHDSRSMLRNRLHTVTK